MRRTLAGAPTALAVLAGGYAARARRISVSAATGLKVDTWSTVRQQLAKFRKAWQAERATGFRRKLRGAGPNR